LCSAPGEDSGYDEVIKSRMQKAFYAGFNAGNMVQVDSKLAGFTVGYSKKSAFESWLEYISQDGIKCS